MIMTLSTIRMILSIFFALAFIGLTIFATIYGLKSKNASTNKRVIVAIICVGIVPVINFITGVIFTIITFVMSRVY